jgi:hypothetical protein
MKISRQRKNTKKKNFGSTSIPMSLSSNAWWKLICKVTLNEKQSIYKVF